MHWSCPLKHKGSKHYRVASNSIFETSHSSRTEHLMFFILTENCICLPILASLYITTSSRLKTSRFGLSFTSFIHLCFRRTLVTFVYRT